LSVLVRVPASSANLGPGFDVLAAALDVHMELEVAETGRFEVRTDLAIARDARNLCVRGFAVLRPPDRARFTIRSAIPLSGGLGTSAAAYVAGLAAADALNGGADPLAGGGGDPLAGGGADLRAGGGGADLLAAAARLEGHPDNAAAALLGGFVVCAGGAAERLDPPPGLEAVLVVPGRPVRTAKARAALPREVPMREAVFNIGHAGLLVLGLARGDLDLVARGLADRLHQPRRASLFPRSMALVERAPSYGALGATISGAGPSVLVWVRSESARDVAARLERDCAGWAQVMPLAFAAGGAEVR
jgi:homoserine kinase